MNTFESLCKTIDENFEDRQLLGYLADVLEEQGDNRARGLRWLEAQRIRPRWYEEQQVYSWGFPRNSSFIETASDLPSTYWAWLAGNNRNSGFATSTVYKTTSEAYLDAAQAFCRETRTKYEVIDSWAKPDKFMLKHRNIDTTASELVRRNTKKLLKLAEDNGCSPNQVGRHHIDNKHLGLLWEKLLLRGGSKRIFLQCGDSGSIYISFTDGGEELHIEKVLIETFTTETLPKIKAYLGGNN